MFDTKSIQVGKFLLACEGGRANYLICITKVAGERVTYFDFYSLRELTMSLEDFASNDPGDVLFTLLSESDARTNLIIQKHQAQQELNKIAMDVADLEKHIQVFQDALSKLSS